MNNQKNKVLENYKDPWTYKGINSSIRKKLGYSRKDVANLSNGVITDRTLASYESGATDASLTKVMKLAKIYRCTMDAVCNIKTTVFKTRENSEIPLLKIDKETNLYTSKDGEIYYADANLDGHYELAALKLEHDNLALHLPKGAVIIIDRSDKMLDNIDYNNTKVLMLVNGEYFPTSITHNSKARSKNEFIYTDINGHHIPIHKSEIEVSTKFIGVIKKAIIDY